MKRKLFWVPGGATVILRGMGQDGCDLEKKLYVAGRNTLQETLEWIVEVTKEFQTGGPGEDLFDLTIKFGLWSPPEK